MAPRFRGQSVAQFTAIGTLADGSTADLTTAASWKSSRISVLQPTAKPGEMQAGTSGDVVVTATVGGVTAEAAVLVIEPGTFKLSGVVKDIATRQGLSGVRVRMMPAQRDVHTDLAGRYTQYDAVGTVQLTASAAGFITQTESVEVRGPSQYDLELRPEVTPAQFSGNWTLTVSASPSCRDRLPPVARDRTYNTTVNQQSARVTIRVTDASVEYMCNVEREARLDATLSGDLLDFVIAGDTDYGDFVSACFVDRSIPGDSIGISAWGRGTVTASEVRITMSGAIQYLGNSTRSTGPILCRADDHVATFRRRSLEAIRR
jgi:hypothetical protein